MNVTGGDMDKRPPESAAEQADAWLARLRSPECNSADRACFQAWLARDPAHWQAYNNAEHVWTQVESLHDDPQLAAMADQVLVSARRRQAAPRSGRWLGWAAAAVLMLGIGTFGVMRGDWFAPAPAVYTTAIGEIRSFTLEEGSVVTLNTDTVLEVRIGRRVRDLSLQRGEAQFKVARDARRPFTVHAPQVTVTAIGTVFQVRSTGVDTEVSLLEGKVRVTPPDISNGAQQALELAPGERLVATAGKPKWAREPLDADAATGWLSGRLVFDSVPLRQAVDEFNRYSQRKLRIGDPALGDIPIQGIFNAGDTESIALALQYAYPIRVDDNGQEVVLHRK